MPQELFPDRRSRADCSGLRGGQRWYAVQTQARAEPKAVFNLENQGFAVFAPMIRKQRRHARKIDTVLAPLFPRYLFVAMDPARERWRSINGTYGVVRLVATGDVPQPVPPGIVETLMARADSRGVVNFGLNDGLKIGEQAKFQAGPFAEMIGRIERLDARGRVHLLFELMGRATLVEARVEDLLPKFA